MKFDIHKHQLAEILANAALFVTEDDARVVLTHAAVTYTGDTIEVVATNSYILGVFTYKLIGNPPALRDPVTFLLPRPAELVAVLRAVPTHHHTLDMCTVEVSDADVNKGVRVTCNPITWDRMPSADEFINWRGVVADAENASGDDEKLTYSFKWLSVLGLVRFNGQEIEHVRVERTNRLRVNKFRGTSGDQQLDFYIMPVRADW
jgi:hypothetical protein